MHELVDNIFNLYFLMLLSIIIVSYLHNLLAEIVQILGMKNFKMKNKMISQLA